MVPVCFLALSGQFFKGNSEYFTQLLQFNICHVSFLRFNSGDHVLIHITTPDLKFSGQVTLGQSMLFSEFYQVFTDKIFLSRVRPWLRQCYQPLTGAVSLFAPPELYKNLICCSVVKVRQNFGKRLILCQRWSIIFLSNM